MRLHQFLVRDFLALYVAASLTAPLAAVEVSGRVVTTRGTPVGHARVLDVHAERAFSTDDRGRFRLDCSEPCLLLVRHSTLQRASS